MSFFLIASAICQAHNYSVQSILDVSIACDIPHAISTSPPGISHGLTTFTITAPNFAAKSPRITLGLAH